MNTQEKQWFSTSDGYIFLRLDSISYFKSDDIYAYIHNGTEKHFSTQSLKEIAEILPEGRFIRCHRSYIVNVSKIYKLVKSSNYKLIMENGHEVPVSRAKKAALVKLMLS